MKKILLALVVCASLMSCEKEETRKNQAGVEVIFGYETDEPVKFFVIEQSFDGYTYTPAITVGLRPFVTDFKEVVYVDKSTDKVFFRVVGYEEDGGYVHTEVRTVVLKD